MQNQAAVEALYSATYVENYLDMVENLPNELQTHISRLRELDLCLHKEFLRDLDGLVDAFETEKNNPAAQRNLLAKIQKGLIIAQDLGDDKLVSVQAITDVIENKARHLEHDASNLEFSDDDDDDDEVEEKTNGNAGKKTDRGEKGTNKTGSGAGAKKRVTQGEEKEKIVKRRKKGEKASGRQVQDSDDDNPSGGNTTSSGRGGSKGRGASSGNASGANANSAQKKYGAGAAAGKRKSSSRRQQNDRNQDDSDHEVDLSHMDIDPDEPTYCLCDQVSYGDMIGCDNDLCPIEWFHFNCVQLTSKPKGRWYCPKCRGDKPTVMKPKQQFLKELEKYNKEREEKMMKQNG